MAVRLSAVSAGRCFIPPNHYFSASSTHFCSRLNKPQGPVGPEELYIYIYIKQLFTSPSLDPATFRLVTYLLNHYTTAFPNYYYC
jgi:hypothetical protein